MHKHMNINCWFPLVLFLCKLLKNRSLGIISLIRVLCLEKTKFPNLLAVLYLWVELHEIFSLPQQYVFRCCHSGPALVAVLLRYHK